MLKIARTGAVTLVLVLLAWASAEAQAVGSEFQVNTYITYYQDYASLAADAAGNFVVVWESAPDRTITTVGQDGDSSGVFGQRFDLTGSPVGAEFQINSYTTDTQWAPKVASDDLGSFVVVWHSYDQDGNGMGIFAQRYDSTGVAVGPEFPVNTYTTDQQHFPSVDMDGAGNFVVVWQSVAQDGDGTGVFGQLFDSAGSAVGSEFQVNTYTTYYQTYPSVARAGTGDFVVVWESFEQDGSALGVFAQRYDAAGGTLGSEFQVNTHTTDQQMAPRVAADTAGNFVVVWHSTAQDGEGYGVFGQHFDSAGAPVSAEFQVNFITASDQMYPHVSSHGGGDFVVVWQSYLQDGSYDGVFGQRYRSNGSIVGPEFQVNEYTDYGQLRPAVASHGLGLFTVVWHSPQDTDMTGVFGRRVECGNGTLEPGEWCDDGNPDDGDGCSSACIYEAPLAVVFAAYSAQTTEAGVRVSWRSLTESGTAAFAIRVRDASGSATMLPRFVLARGGGSEYGQLDERAVALAGLTAAYQIVELTAAGLFGDATPWFSVERAAGAAPSGRGELTTAGRDGSWTHGAASSSRGRSTAGLSSGARRGGHGVRAGDRPRGSGNASSDAGKPVDGRWAHRVRKGRPDRSTSAGGSAP